MRVLIDQIRVSPGRREAQPEHIQELAGSIRELGLLNPITVGQDCTLIAGLHRLEAAKLLSWTEIECSGLLSSSGADGRDLARRRPAP